ncbi:adenylate/guanylate cyclase domain-containing protein [Thalassoporum mexicanum]|uniref:adenylate/guanylate cyclase domain-containing protein n=1 Tax=Thalassoporum mexicanum TaxID=3457544 RepID=UPI0002FFC741|nr:adenylate/guanylate cyclase domain-containing protein [Pseudanabaena sp. PCC 7367]
MKPKPFIIVHSQRGDRQVELTNDTSWTVGRGKGNDVPLVDRCASREHAMFQMVGANNFYLIDLGSSNGSFVNGRRVSIPCSLSDGDLITLGETNIEFFCPEANTKPEPAEDSDAMTDTMALHRRRLITVAVVDICNFTQLTQQMDEQLLSEVIGTWFKQAGDIIKRHDSWVDKYIGDAVMAVWIHGSTNSKSEHIETQEMLKAFKAVYDLAEMSRALNQQFSLPFELKVSAGMNTGYAMIGQMGSNDRPEYTALGDTVNASFRLESATRELELDLAIGQATYNHAPYAAVLLPFAQKLVRLKGYDLPMLTYAGKFEQLGQFISKIAG